MACSKSRWLLEKTFVVSLATDSNGLTALSCLWFMFHIASLTGAAEASPTDRAKVASAPQRATAAAAIGVVDAASLCVEDSELLSWHTMGMATLRPARRHGEYKN